MFVRVGRSGRLDGAADARQGSAVVGSQRHLPRLAPGSVSGVAIEPLEARALLTGAPVTLTPAFVIGGIGNNPTFGADLGKIVRVDGAAGTVTVLKQFQLASQGSFGGTPLLNSINDIARAPNGDIYIAGRGDDPFTAGISDVGKVVRLNPANGATTVILQFVSPGGLNPPPPLLSQLAGIAVAPDGGIIVAGTGAIPSGLGTSSQQIVKAVRIDPANGSATLVAFFNQTGLNVPPALTSVADVAVASNGEIVFAGRGVPAIGQSEVPKVVRVNPATGTIVKSTTFLSPGLNAPAVLNTIASVAVASDGGILLAGTGRDIGPFGIGDIVKVVRIAPNTGAVSVPKAFGRMGVNTPPVIESVNEIAFAPVQGTIGIVGIGRFSSSAVQIVKLLQINPGDGATTTLAQFVPMLNVKPLLTAAFGLTAGPVAASESPVTTLHGARKVKVGRARSFVLKAHVPKALRPADGLYTYQIDWDGDGTTDQTITGGRRLRVRHAFAAAGTFTIAAVASGKDGAEGVVGGRVVTVR